MFAEGSEYDNRSQHERNLGTAMNLALFTSPSTWPESGASVLGYGAKVSGPKTEDWGSFHRDD